ncbi:lysophospholipid acyltransferase family protein [Clostridium thailandense]|uniref:lysophospholipid acyltransferase family protein n=1 Tax=Clostridium thailandense TaxID=2794346 RepID=UPI00398907BD
METVLFYLCFFIYIGNTIFKKYELEKLKKHGSEEEVQECIKKAVKGWTKYVLNKVHAKIEVIGRENLPEENCLYVSNHQGNFDIPIFLEILDEPVGFIAKKEILKFKTFSYWMTQIDCIFMDRDNIRESMKSINKGVELLKNGRSMVIFPEGTRSKGKSVGDFKKGSMKLALKSGVPIVPVTIDGSYKLLEKNKDYNKNDRIVRFIIDKPIYPAELSKEEQVNLAENIKKIISDNINNID